MTRRRIGWSVFGMGAVAALAFVVPGSPLYLPAVVDSRGVYDGHSASYWIDALRSGDSHKRAEAMYAVAALNERAADAVPVLASILTDDPDPNSRLSAAAALAQMVPTARTAAPALAQALNDKEPRVRLNAAIALFRLGADARPAVAALIQAINDPNNQANLDAFPFTIQEMMVLALGRASSGSAEAVPAIVKTLDKDPTNSLRKAVARALGDVGPEARSAAPLLREMLQNSNPDVSREAAAALKAMGSDANPKTSQVASMPPDLELPETERKYIWEIEHHGNVLVKNGFAPFAKALKKADAQSLAQLMSDHFAGADLRDPLRIHSATEAMQVERLEAGSSSRPVTRDAFVARLLELRSVFTAGPPQVKFALMTLSPMIRGKLDGRWECKTMLRMNGEQSRGAPAEVVAFLRFEMAEPTEESLSRPGWLQSARLLQVQTAKSPHYLFSEVARQRGLDTSKLYDNWTANDFIPSPGGVYVCDFDRDGILDVLITDIGATLYRGRPDGKFENVTEAYGLPSSPAARTIAAWIDIDGDGWEDLILAGRIYRNEQGKRFSDVTNQSNLRLPTDAGGIVVADYDRDGKVDLYVTRTAPPGKNSWLEARSGDARGNLLFHNLGNWQFENVTRKSGTFGGHRSTFTAAWLDANNDGWPDLHVINEFGDGGLYINNGDGTFTEHSLADHPADFGSMGLAVGDINNDGQIDIFCANMYSKAGSRVIGNLAPNAYPPKTMEQMRRFVAGSQLHLNKGGLKFEQVGVKMQIAPVGWSYGACLADLDNDGWLDIYATAGYLSRDRNEPDG